MNETNNSAVPVSNILWAEFSDAATSIESPARHAAIIGPAPLQLYAVMKKLQEA